MNLSASAHSLKNCTMEYRMFRIRKITDPRAPTNAETIADVVELLKIRFPLAGAGEFNDLPKKLTKRQKNEFRTEIFVTEDAQDRLRGTAVVLYAPDLQFLFLDYLAVSVSRSNGGVGGALYQH